MPRESEGGKHGLGLSIVGAAVEGTWKPAYIVLQERDWPDVQNSAPFFLSQPRLAGWLRDQYHRLDAFVDGFQAWERNSR